MLRHNSGMMHLTGMLQLYFKPIDTAIPNILLASSHRRLWASHGAVIDCAFTTVTGLEFTAGVRAIVGFRERPADYRDWSHAGMPRTEAMRLYYPSGYDPETAVLGQLCHELGHRFLEQHGLEIAQAHPEIHGLDRIYESHRQLFIFLP